MLRSRSHTPKPRRGRRSKGAAQHAANVRAAVVLSPGAAPPQLPGITFREVARMTPRVNPSIIANSQGCRADLRMVRVGASHAGVFKECIFSSQCPPKTDAKGKKVGSGRLHSTKIILFTGDPTPNTQEEVSALSRGPVPHGDKLWNSRVWLTCTCEYHLYHCEYQLAYHGASSIIHSNGAPTTLRGPFRPSMCKHAWRVSALAVRVDQRTSTPTPVAPVAPPAQRGRVSDQIRKHLVRRHHVPTEEDVLNALDGLGDYLP